MAMKTYKPTTPSQRFRQSVDYSELSGKRPEKSLTSGRASKAGRGAGGRISVRRRGGEAGRQVAGLGRGGGELGGECLGATEEATIK